MDLKNIYYKKEEKTNNINFDYNNYERSIITNEIINKAGWQLSLEQAYFINGIIRKFKPKKCLEIGVANGGSSILILNAIKDIKDSFLVSMDLNTQMYLNSELKTGYRVKKYFPELMKNWMLFTGDQPHKFLDKLNMKFDFVFLDTSHYSPGELLNILEIMPFLNENAIVVLHDIIFHLLDYHNIPEVKYFPSQIYLMTSLAGNKVAIRDKYYGTENIGAIFLNPHQETYYLNYFCLLLSPWEYMPTDKQIDELRSFISKYYKEEIYLTIFNAAVNHAKIYRNKVDRFKIAHGLK
jgi:predicted O-methyltransferase YrrM